MSYGRIRIAAVLSLVTTATLGWCDLMLGQIPKNPAGPQGPTTQQQPPSNTRRLPDPEGRQATQQTAQPPYNPRAAQPGQVPQQTQPRGGQSGPPRSAPTGPQRPGFAPFRLTPEEEAYLDRVLQAWQTETDTIKNFKCKFTRWNYNPAYANPQFRDKPLVINDGELKYGAPDKGTFVINKVQHLDPKSGKYEVAKDEPGEHWVCDGKAIWEYDRRSRRVIERPLPKEMQGKAIRNSPLPFLFGSKAEDLKRRYFMRIVTPKQFAQKEIWVDAYPRFQQDASNFQRAILRLDRTDFHPIALRIYDLGDQFASYEFAKITINSTLERVKEVFAPPRVPFGWKKVLELPPEETAGRPAARPATKNR